MGQVIGPASMSLDGRIPEHGNAIAGLFDWLQNGLVEAATADDRTPKSDRADPEQGE